jgi:Fe-Mn family superoxide dismutase
MEKNLTRREFVVGAAAGAAVVGATLVWPRRAAAAPLGLAPLPYPENALDPYLSANTVSVHYGKHHRGYVDTANKLVAGTNLADLPLEKLVMAVSRDPNQSRLFNAAAQVWNHDFYWKSMRPKGGGKPSGELAARIDRSFGGWDQFRAALVEAATTQFGSGWAWVVESASLIEVQKSSNADTPIIHGFKALLTIDVWEHAYYLDYQNRRADYVNAWLDHLVNWDFAAENLARS